jgi:NADPH-dependent curcumin reductase CurA
MAPKSELEEGAAPIEGNIADGDVSSASKNIVQNKRWVLKQFPEGKFDAKRDVELEETELDLEHTDTLLEQEDSLIVRVEAVSVDAFIRTRMDKVAYHGGHGLGDTLEAVGYGTVVAAGPKAGFKKGDAVLGMLQAADYAILKSSNGLNKKQTLPYAEPTSSLGMLGLSGLACYIGMFVAPPKGPQKGDVVVVSAASGAVGSLACQMAKQAGASKVIGIAGGEHKRDYLLNTLHIDGAVDYKHPSKSIGEQLDELCPDGIDFFLDNVGGDCLDAVLARIKQGARISVCGAASQYDSGNINDKSKIQGPSHYIMLSEKSASMTGYNMMHYTHKFAAAMTYLAWHHYRKTIHLPEHIEEGVDKFPEALEKLFNGGHCGRLIVKIDNSCSAEESSDAEKTT